MVVPGGGESAGEWLTGPEMGIPPMGGREGVGGVMYITENSLPFLLNSRSLGLARRRCGAKATRGARPLSREGPGPPAPARAGCRTLL